MITIQDLLVELHQNALGIGIVDYDKREIHTRVRFGRSIKTLDDLLDLNWYTDKFEKLEKEVVRELLESFEIE